MIKDQIPNSNEVKMPVVRCSFVYKLKFCYVILLSIFRAHLAYVCGFTQVLKNN